MNKQELVEHVVKQAKVTKKQASDSVAAVLDGIASSLKKKKSVSLIGFGSFNVKKRKARDGRNPQTGEKIKIPARNAVSFKVGKTLQDLVNKR